MLHNLVFKSLSTTPLRGKLALLQECRSYSSRPDNETEAADLDAARQWFCQFDKSTIPIKIAKTSFSRSSGPGGQKTNKTSSKATTTWPLKALKPHVPKVLHQGLQDSRYYVASSDSISIQCDTNRSQSDNIGETHRRLHDEITQIYRMRVPGITSPEQKKKIEALIFKPKRGYQDEVRRGKLDCKGIRSLIRQVRLDKSERQKLRKRDRVEARRVAKFEQREQEKLRTKSKK